MTPTEIYELIKEILKKHPSTSEGVTFSRLYSQDDLINDTYLKVYELVKDKTPIEATPIILSTIRVYSFSKYRNKFNPLNVAQELTEISQQSHTNPELEAILIRESELRLSTIVNISNL